MSITSSVTKYVSCVFFYFITGACSPQPDPHLIRLPLTTERLLATEGAVRAQVDTTSLCSGRQVTEALRLSLVSVSYNTTLTGCSHPSSSLLNA
ncbi:hypothetical protein Pcinc_032061 [Petrolisthes cinctipes]|uniref:Uncharacterized protein n=1 Tax=Petrolisthes cinctipes TaxID=88211 RepID=A0AAE1K3N4_PETCI|nr:hypothetical protein Pcinc_032061 [Petrolisthes cinctipes]